MAFLLPHTHRKVGGHEFHILVPSREERLPRRGTLGAGLLLRACLTVRGGLTLCGGAAFQSRSCEYIWHAASKQPVVVSQSYCNLGSVANELVGLALPPTS